MCRVLVETPVKLTAEQEELIKRLDDSMKKGGAKHSPHSTSWVDGVKKFFENMGF
jgi:molecular chaperone DnaJ